MNVLEVTDSYGEVWLLNKEAIRAIKAVGDVNVVNFKVVVYMSWGTIIINHEHQARKLWKWYRAGDDKAGGG